MTLNPHAVARALGGSAIGRRVIAPGPGHSRKDRSLSIEIDPCAPDGFRCHSFAGDDWRECRDYVRHALGLGAWKRRHGWFDAHSADASRISLTWHLDRNSSRTKRALKLWRDARLGAGTIVERYLESRGIVFERWPSSLRLHPNCPRPRDVSGNLLAPLPAMVGLVEHVEHGPVAVQCSYLRRDGSGKADLPKDEQRACFGPVAGGAVRFGVPRAGVELVAGEGIESTLSAALPCGLPAWAALSATGLEKLVLPSNATRVLIAADNDTNGRGQGAAHHAATRWFAEGRSVRVATPPQSGTDFNDVLTGHTAAKISEARHVA
jgi:putative DNA primase/helicase